MNFLFNKRFNNFSILSVLVISPNAFDEKEEKSANKSENQHQKASLHVI